MSAVADCDRRGRRDTRSRGQQAGGDGREADSSDECTHAGVVETVDDPLSG